MVYTQPVVYEFERLDVPTTLMIGSRDRTALGKARLGDYPALGRAAVERMPNAELITFKGVGHLPPIEAPERFKKALFRTLTQ